LQSDCRLLRLLLRLDSKFSPGDAIMSEGKMDTNIRTKSLWIEAITQKLVIPDPDFCNSLSLQFFAGGILRRVDEQYQHQARLRAMSQELVATKLAEIAVGIARVAKAELGVEMVNVCIMNERAILLYVSTICLHLASLGGTRLFRLDLSSMQLGDQLLRRIMRKLVGADKESSRTCTHLRPAARNNAARLQAPPPYVSLSHVMLRDNALGDLAASALASHLVSCSAVLVLLDLRHNHISIEGTYTLKSSMRKNQTIISPFVWYDDARERCSHGTIVCGWREKTWSLQEAFIAMDSLTEECSRTLCSMETRRDFVPHVSAKSDQAVWAPLVIDLRQQSTKPDSS